MFNIHLLKTVTFRVEQLTRALWLSWSCMNSVCDTCKILEQLALKYMVLLHPHGCCLRMHSIRKTYVYTCFCSADGLCQALHPTLPCPPWNWQQSFFKETAGAGSHAKNQLLEMWWSAPRGIHRLGVCPEGLGDWLDCPRSPTGGAEEPEMNTMLGTGNGWFQFSSIIYLLLPLLNPSLKVKPMKITIGLWDVSNYVLHPLGFTGKGNGIQKEQRKLTKVSQLLSSRSFLPPFCFLTYLMKALNLII